MSCEKLREQLVELIPNLVEGTDDYSDATRAKRFLDDECPQKPHSHTASIMHGYERAGLPEERVRQAVQNTLNVAIRLGKTF